MSSPDLRVKGLDPIPVPPKRSLWVTINLEEDQSVISESSDSSEVVSSLSPTYEPCFRDDENLAELTWFKNLNSKLRKSKSSNLIPSTLN
jgi:hypothetical protein